MIRLPDDFSEHSFMDVSFTYVTTTPETVKAEVKLTSKTSGAEIEPYGYYRRSMGGRLWDFIPLDGSRGTAYADTQTAAMLEAAYQQSLLPATS